MPKVILFLFVLGFLGSSGRCALVSFLDSMKLPDIIPMNTDPTKEPSDIELYSAILTSLRQLQNMLPSVHKEVCYGDELGCFHSNGSLHYLMGILPNSPENIQVTFYLYTQSNPEKADILPYNYNISDVVNSHFRSDIRTKLVIHGFGSSYQTSWMQDMKKGFLMQDPMNVFLIDWNKGSAMPHYISATANTRIVGRQVGSLILKLIQLGVKEDDIHIIGHSLGAHTSGFAGKYLIDRGVQVGRISGLDPAGPLFCYDLTMSPQAHLDKSDAKFVDIIHSNGGIFPEGAFGCLKHMGDVDFFPNGGRSQPGCSLFIVDAIKGKFKAEEDLYCTSSHSRACELYAESILQPMTTGCTFPAFHCTSNDDFVDGQCFSCEQGNKTTCNVMGIQATPESTGPHYLITNNRQPLCASQLKVVAELAGETTQFQGSVEMQISNNGTETDKFQIDLNPGLQTFIPFLKDEKTVTQVLVEKYNSKLHLRSGKDIKVTMQLNNGLLELPAKLFRQRQLTMKKLSITDDTGFSVNYCGKPSNIRQDRSISSSLTPGNC